MEHIGCNENCYDSCAGDARATKDVSLYFERKQLLYDIGNYAYIEGHVMGEENQHAQHTLTDVCQEGNVDRVNRVLGIVHAAAEELLYPYTKREVTVDWLENSLEEPEYFVIELRVPVTMSQTTVHLLNKLVHEYMVAYVLYDWLSITHPEASRNWLEKAEMAKREINSVKNSRRGVLRRPTRPF